MTLYVVHQQSRTNPMFAPGEGLGHVTHSLIDPPDDENPSARTHLSALVTSTTITELRHHLRGFVSLLRARGITLDHTILTDDIPHFQQPGGARRVRLTWSQEYQSLSAESPASSGGATPTSATNSATTVPTPKD